MSARVDSVQDDAFTARHDSAPARLGGGSAHADALAARLSGASDEVGAAIIALLASWHETLIAGHERCCDRAARRLHAWRSEYGLRMR